MSAAGRLTEPLSQPVEVTSTLASHRFRPGSACLLVFLLLGWWAQTAWSGMPHPSQQQLDVPQSNQWHHLAHSIGDLIGWQTLLLAAGVGLAVLYQKQIKKWFTQK